MSGHGACLGSSTESYDEATDSKYIIFHMALIQSLNLAIKNCVAGCPGHDYHRPGCKKQNADHVVILVAVQFYSLEIIINRVVPFLLSILDFALNHKIDGQECKKQCSLLVSETASKCTRILLVKNI